MLTSLPRSRCPLPKSLGSPHPHDDVVAGEQYAQPRPARLELCCVPGSSPLTCCAVRSLPPDARCGHVNASSTPINAVRRSTVVVVLGSRSESTALSSRCCPGMPLRSSRVISASLLRPAEGGGETASATGRSSARYRARRVRHRYPAHLRGPFHPGGVLRRRGTDRPPVSRCLRHRRRPLCRERSGPLQDGFRVAATRHLVTGTTPRRSNQDG